MHWMRALVGIGIIALAVVFVIHDRPAKIEQPTPSPVAVAPAENTPTPESPKTPAEATVPPVKVVLSEQKESGFPKTVTVHDGARTFEAHYTGQFTRVRKILLFPVQVYTIASYVESPAKGKTQNLLDDLLEDGPRKVYILRFLRNLTGKQILGAIREEIDETFTDVDMDRLGSNIDKFCQNFAQGSTAGESVYLAWLPGGRLCTSYNKPESLQMIAQDVPLARAIWRIWAGENAGPERIGLVERYATTLGPK